MATQTVFSASNVRVSVAPPTFYVPSPAGVVVPAGGTVWDVFVTSSAYSSNDSADLVIEYQYAGVWQADTVATVALGPHANPITKQLSSTSTFGSSIGVTATPYPSHVRVRVDRIPAGILDVVTLTLG